MQQKPRNIMVPFDGTDISLAAVDMAGALASALLANLTVVHVLRDSANGGVSLAGMEAHVRDARIEELARPALDKAFARLAPHGVQAGERVVVGDPADEILAAIEELNVDLLVLWRTHHSALGELFFGSTSDEVLDKASCPVLVLK